MREPCWFSLRGRAWGGVSVTCASSPAPGVATRGVGRHVFLPVLFVKAMALKIENKNRRTLIHKAVDKKDLDELRRLLDKDPLKPGYEHVDISGGKYVSASVHHSVGLTRHHRALCTCDCAHLAVRGRRHCCMRYTRVAAGLRASGCSLSEELTSTTRR